MPAGADDVEGDADGAPGVFTISAVDEDAGFGGAAELGVADADAVVAETDVVDLGIMVFECFAEGAVKGVDRSVAVGSGVAFAAFDLELDGGGAGFESAVVFVRPDAVEHAAVFEKLEERLVAVELLPDEQLEASFGGFEFVAFVFEFLDLGEELFGFGAALGERVTEFLGFHEDVTLAAEFGDEDVLPVADELGLDVLVGAGELLHGVDVHAALVGKGGGADEGCPRVVGNVGEFVDEEADFVELAEIGNDRRVHLELKIGDDGGEVAVADTLAVTIDGSLNLDSAGTDRSDGVGNSESGIVVSVDADGHVEVFANEFGDFGDFVRESAAVGIAKDDDVGPAFLRSFERLQRVFLVVLVPVEKVLGIVNDFLALILEIGGSVVNHLAVFLGGGAKHLNNVEFPTFAEEGDGRRVGVEEEFDLRIFADLHVGAAGTAKRRNFGIFPFQLTGFLEKGNVFDVGTGPTAFNVVHAEFIEFLSDANLIVR